MGKRYYCDYCERSFADGAENRKKHLASVHHQKLRKAHYDSFKSALDILEEDKLKKPCRRFHDLGHCDYGSGCRYSHFTAEDVQALLAQDQQEKMEPVIIQKPRVEPDIEGWLKTKIDKVNSAVPTASHSVPLPPILSNIPNLPRSLIPCTSTELLNEAQWG